MKEVGDGLFAGAKQFKFMRAFYGLSVSAGIGILVTLVTQPRPLDEIRGWVWGTLSDALTRYKGGPGTETESRFVACVSRLGPSETNSALDLPVATLSSTLASDIQASVGDLLYVSDHRMWLGGLRSRHLVIGGVEEGTERWVQIPEDVRDEVGERVRVQRLY